MNFPFQIFFNDINRDFTGALLKKNSLWLLPFYMATCCYFERVRRKMLTAILSYLRNKGSEFYDRSMKNPIANNNIEMYGT